MVLFAQLLVLDARRQTRQAAHVLTTRMGLSSRGEAIGLVAELGPALVVGAALGMSDRLGRHSPVGRAARLVAAPEATGASSRASWRSTPGARRRARVAGRAGDVLGFVMIKRTRAMEVMRGTA